MDVIGHRGCPAHFPENTRRAIRNAAPHVDMVEIDVRRCGSGELVGFHDERLDRLTETTGPISERPFDALSSLSIEGSGESIPTLEGLLGAAPDGTAFNIELKHTGMAGEVLSLLSAAPGAVLVSSFDAGAIAAFEDETVPTAYLCEDSFEESLDTAVELDCAAIHPRYTIVNRERVARAHDHGLAVNVWTVPTRTAVEELRSAGVDGVIVDSWTVATA